MDAAVVMRLLRVPFRPFALITVSGHEYPIESPQHCRLVGDDAIAVWDRSGALQLIDLRLVERVSMNGTFGFSEFESFLTK